MNKIFIIFVVLLTHLSLCYGENIDGDKLELSPQYEEGTTTSTTEENEMMGTESSDIGSPTVESKQEAVSSQQGTESSSVGSSMVDQPINPSTYQPSGSSTIGSPTLSSQPSESTDTTTFQMDAMVSGTTTNGTESSNAGSPTVSSRQEAGNSPQGAESSSVGSSTVDQPINPSTYQPSGSSTIGSPTLSSQSSESTATTTPQVDNAPPSRIWGSIGRWMIAFSGKPIITGSPSTTGLMLIPTAYRLDKQRKLNIDFMFTYYIGEFWNKTEYKESKLERIDIFNPINRLSCSGDFKYNLIPEKKWIPAIAFGYHSFIVLQGKASNANQMGGAVSNQSDSFGYTYDIMSKSFKNIGFHIGNQSGPIGKLINPISNKLNVTSDKAFIAGLNTIICNRKAFVEIIYPQKKECVMINTFIDKFLPFNFTYIKFNDKLESDTLNGYSVSGYFRIRIPAFPGEKKK